MKWIAVTLSTIGVLIQMSAASCEELRVGFLATLTGGFASLGQDAVNGWKIGLQHEGWTKDGDALAGTPLRMYYADDQLKPDVAVREIERLISSERIHVGAGFMIANIMLAVRKPLIENKKVILSILSGPGIMLGKECTPYFVSTAWAGEQTAMAGGELLNHDNIQRLYILAPNYQGGRETISGVRRTYKGTVVGQSLFKLGESDFQAEISKLGAERPEALFFFGPGAMGIAFMKQWQASGVGSRVKLYTHYVVDPMSLPVLGDLALGSYHVNSWPVDSKDETNQRFIKDYVAKFGHMPSYFGAQSYDGVRLLASALKSLNGKFDDPLALAKAMRHTPYPSTRGYFPYNVNGLPIIDFYKQEAVRNSDGKLEIVSRGIVVKGSKDPYWEECPEANRL